MRMEMRQDQECVICKRLIGTEDHAEDCLQRRVEELLERQFYVRCPECGRGQVGVNALDYFECRACHVQFSASSICAGEDPATLKSTYLPARDGDDYIRVLVMKTPGEGRFPLDERVEQLAKERDAARDRALKEETQ